MLGDIAFDVAGDCVETIAEEVIGTGQLAEIDRVCAAYPELADDDFVERNRDSWFR